MKNINQLFILVLITLTLPLACGDDSSTIVTPDPPDTAGEFLTVGIQVDLPTGVALDLTTTEVVSLFADHGVATDGLTSATYIKDGRSIATLRDSTGQPLLMGFIAENKKELSVSSTVEVAVYIGLGTIFLPEDIKEQFLTEVSTWPGFGDLVTQAESLFGADQNFLNGDAFYTLLQTYITGITQGGDIVDIGTARITVPGDIRSGLQLEEVAGDAIILVNQHRRRAHAFYYKTWSKNLEGVPTDHIPNIVGSNANFQSEVIVGPVSGFSGFIGTLQSAAGGKGIEFARKESRPTTLRLLDSESEAKYKVRAIGPSETSASLTSQEKARLDKLYLETLCFDFALPVFLAMVGEESFLKDFKASNWAPFLNAFTLAVNALPNVSDPLYEGDLVRATNEFKSAMSNGAFAGIFQDLYVALITDIANLSGGFSFENSLLIIERSDQFFKALAVVDKGLQVLDFYRIYDGYKSSNTLEEFEVNLTRNKVSLDPRSTWVIQGEEKVFTTTVHDGNLAEGESYEYRYSIGESYGELRSQSTSATGDSIVSASSKIGYFSSNATSIPDNAIDTITVEVYINHGTSAPLTRVGEGKAAIEIRPLGFEIRPDAMSIDGGTQLKLYVRRTDDTNPVENSTLDYRFIWYTPATYGLFNGTQSDIAVINDNSVTYEALDKETAEGTEDVEVSIYARRKGTTDSYSFVDRISAVIHIENDPLEESFFLDFVTVGEPPHIVNDIYCEWSVQNACVFSPFVPPAGLEVVSYTLTITEGWPAILGTGDTWYPENASLDIEDTVTVYHVGVDEKEVMDTVYVHRIGGTGAQGNAGYCEGTASADYASKVTLYQSFTGRAQVVITLRYTE